MQASDLQTLIDYNYWASAKIIAAAQNLTAEQLEQDAGLSHGSIKDTLAHLLGAEIVWRSRLYEGVSPNRILNGSDFANLNAILDRWKKEEAAMRAYAANLTDESVGQILEYSTLSGKQQQHVVWQLLMHFVNHGTQTRSEAAVALTQMGQSPGEIDFILYIREQE